MDLARRLLAALACLALCGLTACSDSDLLSRDSNGAATSTPPTTSTDTPPTTSDGSGGVNEEGGRAGGASSGDPYFPLLGNEGYDVAHYDLAFDYDGTTLDAVVTIDATATADLDSFNLDFADFTIDDVRVDGAPAPHRVDGTELVIDPLPVLTADKPFVVTISYRGEPQAPLDPVLGRVGWQRAGGITFTSSEPYGAHLWFPANDHPSDKAAFTFRITVDEGVVAVASGSLATNETRDGRTTWVWEHPDPMATYTAAIAIGDLELIEAEGPHGIVIRHAFDPALSSAATLAFADTATMITDLESMFGPYPFDTYGALVLDTDLGYAMENQTLSLFDRGIVDGSFQSSRTMVHELAHHWFGNWVTPATWQDIWLNEGFATYAEELWLEHTVQGYDVDASLRRYTSRALGPIGDPGPDSLFTASSYWRGALTLHALRLTVGDAAFFQTLRAWADRFGGSSATTADFVALASEVAGSDVSPLIDSWLHDARMPALP